MYFKVVAPTYGHPTNNSGSCHLLHSLTSVFYFPVPDSSLSKFLKSFGEHKIMLNIKKEETEGNVEGITWENQLSSKTKDVKTHERRSKEVAKMTMHELTRPYFS